MNNAYWVILVLLASSVSAFVGFWIGKDTGENSMFVRKADESERLRKINHELRIENLRLERSMQYYDDGVLRSILEKIEEEGGPGPWSGQG